MSTKSDSKHGDDPATPKAEKPSIDLPDQRSTPVVPENRTTTAATEDGSWMSLIRRSVYGSSVDLSGQARDEEVSQENTEDKMDLDDSSGAGANEASVDE
jgi:hypothetical protein